MAIDMDTEIDTDIIKRNKVSKISSCRFIKRKTAQAGTSQTGEVGVKVSKWQAGYNAGDHFIIFNGINIIFFSSSQKNVIYSVLKIFICIFSYQYFLKQKYEETILSPLNNLRLFVKKSVDHRWKSLFLDLNSILLVYVIFMLAPHCFAYCRSVVNFKIQKCDSSNFFKILLSIWGPCNSIRISGAAFPFLQRNKNLSEFW